MSTMSVEPIEVMGVRFDVNDSTSDIVQSVIRLWKKFRGVFVVVSLTGLLLLTAMIFLILLSLRSNEKGEKDVGITLSVCSSALIVFGLIMFWYSIFSVNANLKRLHRRTPALSNEEAIARKKAYWVDSTGRRRATIRTVSRVQTTWFS